MLGRKCWCRHRRVAIAARPAHPAHLTQRNRPPRPRPAGRTYPQPCWRRASQRGHTMCHRGRIAFVRDRHIECRPRSAVALPSRAGRGPHRKAAQRASGASRSQRDKHAQCRSRGATALPSHGWWRACLGWHMRVPPPARRDRSETSHTVPFVSRDATALPSHGRRRARVAHVCAAACASQ